MGQGAHRKRGLARYLQRGEPGSKHQWRQQATAHAHTLPAAPLVLTAVRLPRRPFSPSKPPVQAGYVAATPHRRIMPDALRRATLKHIFQKNAIEFEQRDTSNEQRDTRQEDNLYDSVCDVMRFRIFTEISV